MEPVGLLHRGCNVVFELTLRGAPPQSNLLRPELIRARVMIQALSISGNHGVKRSFALAFGGNLLAAGIGLASVIIVSRNMAVHDFGVFSLLLSLVQTLPLYIAFGLDVGMMRFVSKYLGEGNNELAGSACGTLLKFRTASALAFLVLTALWLASPLAPAALHHLPAWVASAVSLGVAATAVLNCLRSALWACQRYDLGVITQLVIDVIKLCAIGGLILLGALACYPAVVVFAAAPLAGLILGGIWVQRTLHPFRSAATDADLRGRLFRFSVWIYLSESAKASLPAVGLFLVSWELGNEQAGVYGLAYNLTYIIPILLMSLRAVLLPHTARFERPAEHARYFRATLQWSVALVLLAAPVLIAAPTLISLIFGAAFSPSSAVFNWLFAAQIAVVAQSPYIAFLSAVNRPRLMAIVDSIRLMLMIAGSALLIPKLGATAPAMVFLGLNLLSYAFYAVYVRRFARNLPMACGTEQIANVTEL